MDPFHPAKMMMINVSGRIKVIDPETDELCWCGRWLWWRDRVCCYCEYHMKKEEEHANHAWE